MLQDGRRRKNDVRRSHAMRYYSATFDHIHSTRLTAAVVRSEAIRSRFKVICWQVLMLKRLECDNIILFRLNLSQEPEIMKLQSRCYEMLTAGEEMPSKAAKSVERQLEELRKAAQGKLALLVLDDIWSREHADPFDCVDDNDSKFLVTTRSVVAVLMPFAVC